MPHDIDPERRSVENRADVSRETFAALERYVELLRSWQSKTNLIAPSTLPQIWTRHVADSLQFAALAPKARCWVDIGSGGGFPGLVTAIVLKGQQDARVHLVESTEKKAAFLRLVIRELALPARVHAMRIESAGDVLGEADAVSARALASLDTLFGMVAGRIRQDIPCYFAKGRGHEEEIAQASAHWGFTMVKHGSTVQTDSVILEVSDVALLSAGSRP